MYKFTAIIITIGLIFFNLPIYANVDFGTHSCWALQDSVWKQYNDDLALYSQLYGKRNLLTPTEYLTLRENYLRKMRVDGLNAWNAQPNDKARYEWFQFTVSTNAPSYYNFALNRFDTGEEEKWNKVYPVLKKEYLDYIDRAFPEEQRFAVKFYFERDELVGNINYHKSLFQTIGEKFNLVTYADPLITLIRKAQSRTMIISVLHGTADQIVSERSDFGLNDTEITSFLNELKQADIHDLTEWADGKLRMLKLKQEPLLLSFKAIDGKQIDITKMRGKVILIDFWATWCSPCLSYMPSIKEVYNKYHKNGFEVISLSINKQKEKQQVLAAERKLAVSWPLGIIGDDKLKEEIWRKFAFTSIPQLILLDMNGNLIENNGRLLNKSTLHESVRNALK